MVTATARKPASEDESVTADWVRPLQSSLT